MRITKISYERDDGLLVTIDFQDTENNYVIKKIEALIDKVKEDKQTTTTAETPLTSEFMSKIFNFGNLRGGIDAVNDPSSFS